MRTLRLIVGLGGLVLGVAAPAMAQRSEMNVPNWPSRYRGGTITQGEVTKVDPAQGTITINTPSGERTMELGSSTMPNIAVGDRVDIQSIPGGRSPSAVGGAASDAPPLERILPALPPAQPGPGLE